MKTWLRFLITFLEAAVVLTVIYFEPTYGVRGVLWREAFYEGKPTSYWRDEIDRWLANFSNDEDAAAIIDWVVPDDASPVLIFSMPWKTRPPTLTERLQNGLGFSKNQDRVWSPPK